MRNNIFLIMLLLTFVAGCETVNKVGNSTGQVIGETTNTIGTVSEGGAEAVQGKTTNAENPYGR